MSTSPSWFDQEKFSRLVKKVGPKPVTEILPPLPGTEPETQSPAGEGLASTARISLVSKPPSLLSEHRALPALPRRTTPLPSIKSLFTPATPPRAPALEQPAPVQEPKPEPKPTAPEPTGEAHEDEGLDSFEHGGHDLTEVWHKMSLLNEELAHTILERDQALNEGNFLREQLRVADKALEEKEDPASSPEELGRLTKERDEAVTEAQALRAQLLQARDTAKAAPPSAPGKTQELVLLTGERDQARRQYADIRKQFESLKQDQGPKEDSIKFRKEWEQQIEELTEKLEERDRQIAVLKANAGSGGNGGDKAGQEIVSLREQLTRAKDEASIAQRGLALSQKALQQTRDTLREATEGTSLSRHNFDNLKNECAILSQQNTVLQAQNDQLTRELAATKSKLTTRL
jgi:hypothetical protein